MCNAMQRLQPQCGDSRLRPVMTALPPRNPNVRDLWTNRTGFTVGAVNSGETAMWTGKRWMPTFGLDPATIKISNRGRSCDLNETKVER